MCDQCVITVIGVISRRGLPRERGGGLRGWGGGYMIGELMDVGVEGIGKDKICLTSMKASM